MRKVNYLLAGLATLFMASCSNEESPSNNGGNGADGKASYLAVRIANPTGTRADSDYEYGEGAETEVKSIVFYLFDKNGAAFPLKDETDPTRDFNKVQTLDDDGNPTDPVPGEGSGAEIENIYNPTLVIKHEKGEIPAYMVAIVNKDLGEKVANIDELRGMLSAEYGDQTSFVMSNAITEGGLLTPITAANLAETIELAKANPVRINVERVLAKLRTKLTNANETTTWDTGETADGTATGKKLYARLDGWTVTNTASDAYLIKNIKDINSQNAWAGWSAGDRSFWANTDRVTVSKYQTPYNAIGNPDRMYLMENTDQDNPTTVMVKATLVNEDGNPVSLARWNGLQYPNLDEELTTLKTAMLVFLKGQGKLPWVGTAAGKREMGISDFRFKTNADKKWRVNPVPVEGSAFYATSDADTAMTEAEVNAVFAMLGTAMIWTDGQTLYHTTIKHSVDGAPEGLTGVVRNHIYDVQIAGVQGLGIPVFDPEEVYDPEDPEYTASSLYAEVSILAFRIVINNPILGGE